jgi:hypothetical protein
LSSTIEILSASQPMVSATMRRYSRRLRCPKELPEGHVDSLDQVVALLVEAIDVALCRRDLAVVVDARFVLLVPQLDVRRRETGDESAYRVIH